MARQQGVELRGVVGSGPQGRIKAADVQKAVSAATTQGETAGKPTTQARRQATSIEQTIAARLTASKQTIPHFYVLAQADVTELLSLRATLNADPGPVKISVNHLVVAAVAQTLAEQPDVNAVWDEGEIVSFDTADIGVAVETPRGLLAPVLRDAGRLSIDRLAGALDELINAAREGRLSGDQLKGGAISVSNVGMFGVANLVPIINPGQAAILGVGATKPTFLPDADGAPVLRQVLGLTLSCDHRVIDGARAARFLDAIAKRLEKPLRLLRN
jgi:pyruvate dehydrogenase E2 component (dihydrolipoamide acetyltransferase)